MLVSVLASTQTVEFENDRLGNRLFQTVDDITTSYVLM